MGADETGEIMTGFWLIVIGGLVGFVVSLLSIDDRKIVGRN
jgi:hypothetical protein